MLRESHLQVGKWQLHDDTTVSSGDESRRLTPRAYDLLVYLAERPGRLVTNGEVVEAFWSHRYVSDSSVYKLISEVRRALDDDPKAPTYIRTVSKRGYMLIAEVTGSRSLRLEPDQTQVESYAGDEAGSAELQDRPEGPARSSKILFASGVGAAIIAVLGVLLWSHIEFAPAREVTEPVPAPIAHEHVVMVLPFESLSPSSEDQYLAMSVYGDILTEISRLHGLKVIGRLTAMRFRQGNKSLGEMAAETGATHIVLGSVQRVGDMVRVDAELDSMRDHIQLWAESYDEPAGEAFHVREKVVAGVAQALGIERSVAASTQHEIDTRAHDLYVRAQGLLDTPSPENLAGALELLQEAIEADPGYAAAYSLAVIIRRYYLQGGALDNASLPGTREFAEKALKFDPQSADSEFAMALVASSVENRLSHFAKAVALNPNDSRIHTVYSSALSSIGRMQEAFDQNHAALELDPLSATTHLAIASMLPWMHRPGEADEHLQRALELEPDNPVVLMRAADYERITMRPVDAIGLCLKAHRLNPQAIAPVRSIVDILLGLREYQAADHWIDQLPRGAVPTHYELTTRRLLVSGAWEQAYSLSRTWLRELPGDATGSVYLAFATGNLARKAYSEGRTTESEAQRRRAISLLEENLAPDMKDGHYLYSLTNQVPLAASMLLHHSLGDVEAATRIAHDILSADPYGNNWNGVEFYRGTAYAVLGETENAAAAFRKLADGVGIGSGLFLSGTIFDSLGLTSATYPNPEFDALRSNAEFQDAVRDIYVREAGWDKELRTRFREMF